MKQNECKEIIKIIDDNFAKWQNEEIEDVIDMIFEIKQKILQIKWD